MCFKFKYQISVKDLTTTDFTVCWNKSLFNNSELHRLKGIQLINDMTSNQMEEMKQEEMIVLYVLRTNFLEYEAIWFSQQP